MAKKARLAERAAKALARWADVPLAEDEPGATVATASLPALTASVPAGAAAASDAAADAARQRFERWRDADPFPDILPALLNSADIDDYMHAAAMVHPYDPEKRKTASYALSVGREIAYWDPNRPGEPPIRTLNPGDPVVIPSNSLIYIRTAELFQLPNYMAVRFNLHIDLVHKGLLLGTGPLVDPGFRGRLMVPLHNLTSNTYVIAVGDDFIWAEFTKTSMTETWAIPSPDSPPRTGAMLPFPDRKLDKPLDAYVRDAQRGHKRLQPGLSYGTLQNAIPDAIARTRRTAETAKASAAKSKRRATQARNILAGLGGFTLLGASATLWSQIQVNRSALQTTLGLVTGTGADLKNDEARIRDLEVEVRQLKAARQQDGSAAPENKHGASRP